MISSNIVLATGNKVNGSTLTGAATKSGYPLSNLSTMGMHEKCVLTEKQDFIVIEMTDIFAIQLIGLLKTNLSFSAKWKVRLADTQANLVAAPVYDSGWLDATPPSGTFGDLPWGKFNWGGVPEYELLNSLNNHSYHVAPDEYFCKFIRIDFDDFQNTGDITLARLWLGDIYQPTLNPNYGVEVSIKDNSVVRQKESGTRTYGTSYKRRYYSFGLEEQEDEFFRSIYGPLFVTAGIQGEILFILRPTLPETHLLQSVYGNLVSTEPANYAFYEYNTTKIAIDERV